MKYIFIVLTAVICSATGLSKANKLSRKRSEIEQTIDLLEEIRRNIKYCENTLEVIVSQYCVSNSSKFSQKLAVYSKVMDFPDAWKKAFNESGSVLDEKERHIFLSFGEKLGTSDCESQDKLIEYTVSHFSRELEKAEKNESEKKRLYIVSGIAAGLVSAIMML